MRLGDYIDDYCKRCKRSTDHSIGAIVGEEVQKVTCRICHTEHKYLHNQDPKKELTKEAAFQKVLASVTGQMEGKSEEKPKKRRKQS